MFYTNKNFLIFDFDGVLVESNKIKNDEFYSIWFNTVDNSAIKKAIDECSTRIDIITSIYNNYFPNKLKNGYHLSFFINLYSKNVEEKIILLGVKSEMLDFLKNTNKKLVINSATPNNYLRILVDRLGIIEYFDALYGADNSKEDNFFAIKSKEKLFSIFFLDLKPISFLK